MSPILSPSTARRCAERYARPDKSKGSTLARADLHQAFAIDRDVYEAARTDRAVLDPIVRINGGVPGTARPFMVVREYQGPQGTYVESFVLTDPHGATLTTPSPGRITLRGEAFEDRFLSEIRNVTINQLGEHRLTFYIGDDEVGDVPVFVEPEGGGSARTAAEATFAAALKKSTIMWVTVPPRPNGRRRIAPEHTQPVWFVTEGDKIYLLHGPGEQQVPGLGETPTVRLNARGKDTRSLVADVVCDVEIVPPDDERWDKVTQKASTRRLNMSDAGDTTIERWRETCQLLELTPQFGTDEVADAAAALSVTADGQTAQQGGQAAASADRSDEIHVEAQVDQEVMDRLVGEGLPERVARAKAKAHYVRSERERIRAERDGGGNGDAEESSDGESADSADESADA
ncbi:hypothetical protein BH23ACT10_BH23ACT10_04610 [soil metagenome]